MTDETLARARALAEQFRRDNPANAVNTTALEAFIAAISQPLQQQIETLRKTLDLEYDTQRGLTDALRRAEQELVEVHAQVIETKVALRESRAQTSAEYEKRCQAELREQQSTDYAKRAGDALAASRARVEQLEQALDEVLLAPDIDEALEVVRKVRAALSSTGEATAPNEPKEEIRTMYLCTKCGHTGPSVRGLGEPNSPCPNCGTLSGWVNGIVDETKKDKP